MDNLKYYNPLYSPIHICDNISSTSSSVAAAATGTATHHPPKRPHHLRAGHSTIDADMGSTIIRVNSMEAEEEICCAGVGLTLAPSSAYKNSKSRRMEYSMRGTKLGVSNPSQDSAFGSMTDGELSRASSFKLSSFQSVSSPIDEGVEELDHDHLRVRFIIVKLFQNREYQFLNQVMSAASASCGSSVRYIDSSANSSPCRSISSRDPSPQPMPEPPKLVINDQSCSGANQYIYTSSPIRKCATTEVFSQKYRVSSFEDMSANRLMASFGKKSFKSLEEEPDSTPERSPTKSKSAGKEKGILFKNSILSRKNRLIKSTESFFECATGSFDQPDETEKLLESPIKQRQTAAMNTPEKSSRFDRHLFCLSKLKQTPIQDSLDLEYPPEREADSTTKTNNSRSSSNNSESSLCKSLSQTDIQKFINDSNIEEETPLLDGMELSPISPASDD